MKSLILCSLILSYASSFAQRDKFVRPFQLSLTPGISTNGLHAGGFTNKLSINLSSGYSDGTGVFELGVISNLNVTYTQGLQIAGLVNVTGGDAYAQMSFKEIDRKVKSGFEANMVGAQFAGLANVVLNNAFGWQASGGVNLAKGALQGFQLAGLSNTVYKYSFGVQLAGLYNVSVESMDGVQVASLFNITTGGLYGLQLGLFNKAGFTEGINSGDENVMTGVQIGLINKSGKANGFQIGILNMGGRMQGTQIGLVNIFKNGKEINTRNGTPIAPINIGTEFHLAWYATDLFLSTVEVATGTIKNIRMRDERKTNVFMNSLIYATEPDFFRSNRRWALGYGLKKLFYSRSADPAYTHINFFAVGIDWMHINHQPNSFTKGLSLLTRPSLSAGSRLHPRNRNFYIFGALAYNVYTTNFNEGDEPLFNNGSATLQHRPGFTIGVLMR